MIIGRRTFSAASYFATALEYRTKAIFAGEPTGGSPNHSGDAEPVTLPNSAMMLRVSRIFWQNSTADDDRLWHAPDLPVPVTYEDYRSGRDPVLEAVLDHVLSRSEAK